MKKINEIPILGYGTWPLAGDECYRGVLMALELGIRHGGTIPASGVAWLNLPVDVVHVLAYFVAHEGHHRGQIVLLARQTGHRLPIEITGGLWQWSKRAKEAQSR